MDAMDPELVVQAQRGDQAAFASITQATYARMLDIAYRILRDRELAEDAAQQALVDAWRTLPHLRDVARFEAWTYRILVRACHREVRRRGRLVLLGSIAEPSVPDGLANVHDRDLLERAFRTLSMDQRTVVVLHHSVGLTLDQIAEVVGVPAGTVSSRLARAMARLRLELQDEQAQQVAPLQEAAR
jgi:RNA polymerase sigma-70 factor (ECF subfamily)